jgi:hypothetical protein
LEEKRREEKRREEKKKSVNSELVIMSYVAVKGPNETHM